MVSWVNPDATYRDVGMDDYVEDGYLTAIREVKAITGQKQVNAVGYCIAGTTLALTLSLLKQRGDKSIKSATFFTALTDFSDQGEFTPFLQDDFIDGIEAGSRLTKACCSRSSWRGRSPFCGPTIWSTAPRSKAT